MDRRKQDKKRPDSHSRRIFQDLNPELEDFFSSVHERLKNLAVAQKAYRSRNDKELSVRPGEFFEVLDDVGSWWCLRAPSGRTGHVPKTHLEIIRNPVKEAERFDNQPVDPIVVKVPVIVKTTVQHQGVEEAVKPGLPKCPVKSPLPKEVLALDLKPVEEKTAPMPPPQPIFPPPKPCHDRFRYPTVVKEIIREVSPCRHSRRPTLRHQSKQNDSLSYSDGTSSFCSSRSSSSSDDGSWISDERYERGSRNRRLMAKPQHSSPRSVTQLPRPPELLNSLQQPGHCCHERVKGSICRYRSMCCNSSARSRARTSMADKPHLESKKKQQQVQQPQPPMIILLESPKLEAPQQSVDDYYDPYAQPQISIVFPSNAQIAPHMSAYTPLQSLQPQYPKTPAYYNWSPQYYQSYA